MDKSPDAFRTISEVADVLETPAHVLRFWESRFPQIRPVKRAGGRRYYRPADVALLTGIKRLLHDEGLTIRDVQRILREQGIRQVANLPEDMVLDGADLDFAEDDLPQEAGFLALDGFDTDDRADADAAGPDQAVLPLFGDDFSMADAALPPLMLSRRPTPRDDASFGALIRDLPKGAFAGRRAEVAALARRLQVLRDTMVSRAQGGMA